jgi:hypothetical protein
MTGLTNGELFIVAFVTVAVLSAPWWPKVGQWAAELVSGERDDEPSDPGSDPRQ